MDRVLPAVGANLTFPALAAAENWPAWRGPRLDGSSLEKGLPLKWSETENVAWKTPIPGIGHSSPIVIGDRVFVTSCLIKEKTRVLLCLDRRDGHVLWQREVLRSPLEPVHQRNSQASSTPAADSKHVYVSFLRLRPKTESDGPPTKPIEKSPISPDLVPEMVVTCYDLEGNKVWEKVPGRFYSRHGYCISPIRHKDLVIVNGDQDALAFIVALDRTTGEEVWRINRPNRTRSYVVPVIANAGGRTHMVPSPSKRVTTYAPHTAT